MIKQLFHKVFSIGLAAVMLLSTLSFTIEKHYCGNVLVDVSVFSEAEKCAMEAYEVALETKTKKSCCKDVVDIVEGQDQLIVKYFDDLDLGQQVFITSYVYSYLNIFETLATYNVPHRYYDPPDLVVDIQKLDQVYLI